MRNGPSRPSKAARLTLPNDLAFLPVAISFVRENASLIGFDDQATRDIELATEEAVSNVIEHAFSAEEDAEFHILCDPVALGLRIIIQDKGQPFDPTMAPDHDPDHPEETLFGSGLGLFLMRNFMDDISFHILGREGKELHLVKYLGGEPADSNPAADACRDKPESQSRESLAPMSVAFSVRIADPAEAVEISKCAYDAYHYSYGHEHIYYPERLKELLLSGTLISAVAVADDEDHEIMAHMALVFDDPVDRSAEIGMAFTKKRYQNQGCGQAIGSLLLEEAVSRGLHGIFVDCTTAHVYSQKAALSAGARECCILLGIDPEAQSWTHFASQGQRVSNVIAHIQLRSTSKTSADGSKIIHAPAQHREMIEKIYTNLGESPMFRDDPVPVELPDTLSVVEIHTGKAYQQSATIAIRTYGADIVQQVGRALKRLCLDKLEVVYLYLDLEEPLTAVLTSRFEALGFFFAGVIPKPDCGDRLELQFLNNVLIDYDQIQLYSDFAKEMLAYVQAHDPMSNEAYLR